MRRQRPFFLRRKSPTCEKLAALRAATLLRQGGLIAHHAATLAGVVAHPGSRRSIEKLHQFKQRTGPFLLLADSMATAMSLSRYCSPELRRRARAAWPGPVTMVFVGKPGLPACCYQHGKLAVRVDASLQTRQLAAACGGLVVSSSLNRRGAASLQPGLKCSMRMHRLLRMCLTGAPSSGKASSIMRVWRNNSTIIRR
ncbi:MAG: Sua5/YciO/YrdC/YwlC family protein [Mariprofundus sp.]|nr:Sua5/YciO/YrdC/YwlC family protein [Mariprofundus sp.]